jgi:DnaJ like chaperone protein
MSIWGKLTGAAAGLAIGGPIGALIGGVAGHLAIDHGNNTANSEQGRQLAFTAGVIALGAKMAKADGVVTKNEIRAFNEVFKVSKGDTENVARLFNLAKRDVAGYEIYARQLDTLFHDNRDLLRDVLGGLFHIAVADGVLHPKEEDFLRSVATEFGFTQKEFLAIKGRYARCASYDPYNILGIAATSSDSEVKAHYHKLVAENHPDRAVARGLPKEMVEIATKKLAAINAAYEEVVAMRRTLH